MDIQRSAPGRFAAPQTTRYSPNIPEYRFGHVSNAIFENDIEELHRVLSSIRKMPPASVYQEIVPIWETKRNFVHAVLEWGDRAHKFQVLQAAASHIYRHDEDENLVHNSVAEEISICILTQSPDVICHRHHDGQPTVLHIAAKSRSEALAQTIFSNMQNNEMFDQLLHVRNNQGSKTPLRIAVENDSLFFVRQILRYNTRPINDSKLLKWVLNEGTSEALQTLIELRPEEMDESVLQHALKMKSERLINALKNARECRDLFFRKRGFLHQLVKDGETLLVNTLLDKFPELALELDEEEKPVLSYNSDESIRDRVAGIILRTLPSMCSEKRQRYYRLCADNSSIPSTSEIVRALIDDVPDKRKEISLSLGGFGSWVSHAESFLGLIQKSNSYTSPDDKPSNALLQLMFEKSLIFVDIPITDLPAPRTDGKPTLIRSEVWSILNWLKKTKHVEGIYELSIRDSCYLPHAENVIRACLKDFNISVLDWRCPDLSLEVLHDGGESKTPICPDLETLRLYARGWPALAYWTSEESLYLLGRFTRLKQVEIFVLKEFVGMTLCETYATEATERFDKFKTAHSNAVTFELEITPKRWSDLSPTDQRPVLRRETTAVEVTKLGDFLLAYESIHRDFANQAWRNDRLEKGILCNDLDESRKHTPYIRVAIIDNGVDPESIHCHKITGASFVPSHTGESNWWYIRHPHGTKMARIVTDLNPHCHLLVAKVGDSRSDFTAARIIKALGWAVAAGADIISLSLTLDKEDVNLELAVNKAAASGAVILASVRGEGVNTEIKPIPAAYGNVLAIGSADGTGAASSGTLEGQARHLFPGERIVAHTEYLGGLDDAPNVSGPSVATAVAAGVASLVLSCNRFALFKKRDFKRPDYHHTLQVNVVKQIFEQMSDGKYVRPWVFFKDEKAKPSWGEGDSVLDWIEGKYRGIKDDGRA
ncbi:hypothetical protein MHUMG1_06613 [Metarhizium humberi]|uniref:Peptidase S8/S53 domain-containing protein n=1 Tax=Metarhizium humberi TaxID=2596975 RepID=A0A9P8M7Q1_9HYPO|nr:hypothetical protein MHUMG1_06613 [Metarhizium humberi]